jgi:hypothetical protein
MRTLKSLVIMIVAAPLFIGCANENKSSTVTSAASGITCPAGSTPQLNVCVAPNGTVTTPGYGTNPATGVGTAARFYSENWRTHNLNVTGSGYTGFIQNVMGVCGPYTQDPNCAAWTAGAFDIVLLSDNVQANQLTAVFRVKPRGAGPGFAPAVVPINFTLSVTNNYQGFEARGYGPFTSPANRSLIQIQVATGKLQDTFFDYRIAYRGEIIIEGRFQRCSTADCGLSSNIGI